MTRLSHPRFGNEGKERSLQIFDNNSMAYLYVYRTFKSTVVNLLCFNINYIPVQFVLWPITSQHKQKWRGSQQ